MHRALRSLLFTWILQAQPLVPTLTFDESIPKIQPTLTVEQAIPTLVALPKQITPNILETTPVLVMPIKPNASQQNQKSTTTIKIGKHGEILDMLRTHSTKPFTISYTEALNAMSKIDITELPPKRGGDFRKLVRLDAKIKSLAG